MERSSSSVEVTMNVMNNGRVVHPVQVLLVAEAAENLKRNSRGRHYLTRLMLRLSEHEVSRVDIATLFSLDLPNIKVLRLEATPPAHNMDDYLPTFERQPYPTNPGADFEDFVSAHAAANPSAFSYHQFLDALVRWSGLEVIEIFNFLHIPSKDAYDVPTLASPIFMRNLNVFTLKDLPGRMQFFLGYLHLAPSVKVWLTATTGMRPLEADMVQEMIPQQPAIYQNLPMRNMAGHVQVIVGPVSLGVGGCLSYGDGKGKLVLELTPADTGTFDSHDACGDILRCILRSLPDIFNPSVVMYLRICGEIACVRSGTDWASVLHPFRNLETLHLEDYALGKHGSVGAFSAGLAVNAYDVQERREAPVCPRLRLLCISDASVSRDGTESMYKALEYRKKRGCPLPVFKLQFQDSDLSSPELQQAVDKLSGVAAHVEWQEKRTLLSYVPMRPLPPLPPAIQRTKRRR